MYLSHLLLPKIKKYTTISVAARAIRCTPLNASAKAKEGENTKIQFWRFWSRLTVQGQSGTPPVGSNVREVHIGGLARMAGIEKMDY